MKKYAILLSLLMVGTPAYSQLKWLTKFAGLFKVRSSFLERRRIQRKHLELMKKEELAAPLFNTFSKAFYDSPAYVFPTIVSPILSKDQIEEKQEQLFEELHKPIQDKVLFCQSSLQPDEMTSENITTMLDRERKHFVTSTKIFFGVRKLVEVAEGIAQTDHHGSSKEKQIFDSLETKLHIIGYSSANSLNRKISQARTAEEKTIFYDAEIQEYRKKCLDALKEAQQQNQ